MFDLWFEKIMFGITFFMAIGAYFNGGRVKKRLDTLEIVLAKKKLLTWDDPAWDLNEADKELLRELSK